MSIETADALIKYILKLPKMEKFYIHWFGGEPLLNTKVIDKVMEAIYDKLKANGTQIFVYFTSNGSMLDKKMSCKAKKIWHANYFQITIDDIGEKYDSIKRYTNKKYNYNRVIKNINYLLKEKIQVILRINYYPNEVDKVKNIIDVLSEKFDKMCKNNELSMYFWRILMCDRMKREGKQVRRKQEKCRNILNRRIEGGRHEK